MQSPSLACRYLDYFSRCPSHCCCILALHRIPVPVTIPVCVLWSRPVILIVALPISSSFFPLIFQPIFKLAEVTLESTQISTMVPFAVLANRATVVSKSFEIVGFQILSSLRIVRVFSCDQARHAPRHSVCRGSCLTQRLQQTR